MPVVIFVDHLGHPQESEAFEGGSLIKLCHKVDSPIPFHCRRAKCGMCRMEILEGADTLLPAGESELKVLEVFGLPSHQYRLACQAQMYPGFATLRVSPLEKRTPRRHSLWLPVTLNTALKQIQVCVQDTNLPDIFITGTTELKVSDIAMVTFRLPMEEKSRNVVGRIIQVESLDGEDNNIQSYKIEIEFFEHDEILTGLFGKFPS